MTTIARVVLPRALPFAALASLWLAPIALAQAPQTFTPKTIVQFAQGGDRERAMLSQMPGLGDLVKGQFGVGAADLNADGKAEMIVLSLTCNDAGCPVVALQNNGSGKVAPIFAQRVAGRLAVTNETVNGYNAFAAADQAGAIMKDGSGKALVYPVGARPPAAANTLPAPAAPTAPRPPAPAAPTPAPAVASASAAGGEYLPMCTLPRCLNPRVVEKAGIGTANATARAEVTLDDATRWCAQYQAGYKACAEDQVAQGGTGGGAKFRTRPYRASANCQTGTLAAVDGGNYKYVGTWTEGSGAGRAKFGGNSGVGTRVFEQQGGPQVANGSTSIFQLALDPNSGESLAIQWEILCAGSAAPAQ